MRIVDLVRTVALALTAACCFLAPAGAQTVTSTTLKLASGLAEGSLDPIDARDIFTNELLQRVFDSPLRYDSLARTRRLKPNTADGMPTVSPDGRVYTVRIRPGIYFSDDPAFKHQRRELTAADYVYGLKRMADPLARSTAAAVLREMNVVGFEALREDAIRTKKLDIDRPLAGLKTTSRYVFQITLAEPRAELLHLMAGSPFYPMAREVVEAYGDKVGDKPVGTSAYRLAEWRRGSRIVFERNPAFREEHYSEEGDAGDTAAAATARRLKGRRIPLVDRVQYSVIEEAQPRWLAFMNGEIDYLEVPADFTPQLLKDGKLAPDLAARGLQLWRYAGNAFRFITFGMDHPVVGGYAAEQVALRRAIATALDRRGVIAGVHSDQVKMLDTLIVEGMLGHDSLYNGLAVEHSAAKARAMLDTYGWRDRDGDGWREAPDGSRLSIEMVGAATQSQRAFNEIFKRNMDAIGVRTEFRSMPFQDMKRAAAAGQLMMWRQSWWGQFPQDLYGSLVGSRPNTANPSRFNLPRYNDLFIKQLAMPFGQERTAVWREMDRLLSAFTPLIIEGQPIVSVLAQAQVVGLVPKPFGMNPAYIGLLPEGGAIARK